MDICFRHLFRIYSQTVNPQSNKITPNSATSGSEGDQDPWECREAKIGPTLSVNIRSLGILYASYRQMQSSVGMWNKMSGDQCVSFCPYCTS